MNDQTPLGPCGHAIGRAFGGGFRCSGKSCGKVRYEESKLSPKPIVQKMPEEEIAIQKRAQMAQLPQGLTSAGAVEWGKEKLATLVPEAVAQLMSDLRYGNSNTKSLAAEKILRANGLDKREAVEGNIRPAIILNINAGDSKAPWLERIKKDPKKGDK